MATLVSQYAYARHRGISRQAVSKAVREGRIRLVDGKVPLEESDQLGLWTSPKPKRRKAGANKVAPNTQSTESGKGSGPVRAQALAMRDIWRARRERLEYQRKAGELLAAAEVRIAAFEKARQARDLLLRLPDRLAPVLAHQPESECHRILAAEMQAVCAQLAKKE